MESRQWKRSSWRLLARISLIGGLWFAMAAPPRAAAFCGFYVSGADASLYANATMVVLMREGTKTLLSMQNNYEGPAEDFALVIPVPTVLSEEQVKVLPHEVFGRVDALSAPRLVEYWEHDPCQPIYQYDEANAFGAGGDASVDNDDGVVVEASFAVGEYDVQVLSADDSTGLDTWLRSNGYNIPEGAAPVLAPYVAAGTKFFVAKVDPERIEVFAENGQALLSPLRFHYDSADFALPIRLGLLNSQGTQDLIVHILAADRYVVTNRPGALIPTNIKVKNNVREAFGSFYESLFAEVLAKEPGAVVTEYAWDSSTCDPCPTPPLTLEDLATLGDDVLQRGSYVLTRLHYRYKAEQVDEDLVFEKAAPLIGGRGVPNAEGELTETTGAGGQNAFQGRYVILHPWEGEVACEEKYPGLWGGPLDGADGSDVQGMVNGALLGKAPVAGDLSGFIAESIPELDVEPSNETNGTSEVTSESGSGCQLDGNSQSFLGLVLSALGVLALWSRRRYRQG